MRISAYLPSQGVTYFEPLTEAFAKSVDPDQPASEEAAWSVSTLFASHKLTVYPIVTMESVKNVGLTLK